MITNFTLINRVYVIGHI